MPLLLPSLRVILKCAEHKTGLDMVIPYCKFLGDDGGTIAAIPLFDRVMTELDKSLTAAIVGMAFSTARDFALLAMLIMRREAARQENNTKCQELLLKVAEALRVRYESERRLRDNALFDAYEEDCDAATSKNTALQSMAIEKFLVGEGAEEASNDKDKDKDDYILFHCAGQDPTSVRR